MNCHDSYEDWYADQPFETAADKVEYALKTLTDELFLDHTDCDEDTIIESLLEIYAALKLDAPNFRNKDLAVTSLRNLKRTQEIYESKLALDKEFVTRHVKSISTQLYGKNELSSFNIDSSVRNLLWHCDDESPLPGKTITIKRIEV